MSLIKLGDGIVEINGREGGDIYRRDRCGQHVQAQPREIKRPSAAKQRKRRRAWKKCLNWIRRNMTTRGMALWQQYANQHPHKNKKGEWIALTWWQMFIKINVIRLVNDLEILPEPPE